MTSTILIVDDSTFIVEGLVALLKKSYNPLPSFGGEECLEILRTVTPSLIILDIMMEPMDGWETLARIKNNSKTRHIPVLMFSAKKISPGEAEAHRIIIDDFLTKPVNPRKLIEAIEKVLARQESNKIITDTWEAAGVSRVIIDEYLTLKTNLDVDRSLLSVMNKQLEMAYPDAGNRSELEHSIAALESRIVESQTCLDTFCQEQSGVLPLRGLPEGRAPPSVILPERAPAQPVPETIPVKTAPEEFPSPAATPQKLAAPSSEPAAAPPVLPVKDEGRISRPVEIIPPASPPPSWPTIIPSTSYGSSNFSGITLPEKRIEPARVQEDDEDAHHTTIPVSAPKVASPRQPASEKMNVQPVSSSLFEPYDPLLVATGPAAQQKAFSDGRSPVSRPAARIMTRTPPSASKPLGGGTRTPSMQDPGATRREPAVTTDNAADRPVAEHPPAASGGFLSRIIASITGLFTRNKP